MTTPGRKGKAAVADSANLDIVRAIAVMLVFISHVPTWKEFALARGFYMGMVGSLGVSIFFVHTSLVLMASLERLGREAHREGTYGSFAIRRAFRVYPLSILAVLTVQALAYLGAWQPLGIPALVANLLLVQNLSGAVSAPATLWSLPYEIQMYLVLPLLFDLVVREKRSAGQRILLLWAIVVVTCTCLAFLPFSWAHSTFKRLRFAAHFLPGILAYATIRASKGGWTPWASGQPASRLPLFLAGCAVTIPLITTDAEPRATVAQWVVCITLGFLIPRCRESANELLNRGAGVVAKYSYGIYLTHFPCVELIYASTSPVPASVRLPMLVLVTGALSFLAYHVVEAPLIGLGRRVASSSSSR